MRHKSDIGLVDAHAKGNGSHNHNALIAQEPILVFLSNGGVKACVVRQGIDACFCKQGCHFFDTFARLTINHTGIAFVFALNEAQQLGGRVFLLNNGVTNVGTVEATNKEPRIF